MQTAIDVDKINIRTFYFYNLHQLDGFYNQRDKENFKFTITDIFIREFTCYWWIPLTKGQ